MGNHQVYVDAVRKGAVVSIMISRLHQQRQIYIHAVFTFVLCIRKALCDVKGVASWSIGVCSKTIPDEESKSGVSTTGFC